MRWIIVKYVYKRWGEWYFGRYVTRTKLELDEITMKTIKPEIQSKEKVSDVVIIEYEYE